MTRDLFAPAVMARPMPAAEAPAPAAVVIKNRNGAFRCRAPGCAADGNFGFGGSGRHPERSTWFCLAHRDTGREACR